MGGGVQWCKMPRRGKGWQTFDIHELAHIRDFDFFSTNNRHNIIMRTTYILFHSNQINAFALTFPRNASHGHASHKIK